MKKYFRGNDKNRIFAAVNWNKLKSVIIKNSKKMKRFYMLILAAIVAVSANAQITSQNIDLSGRKSNLVPPMKQAKGVPGETWFDYPTLEANFFGADDLDVGHLWFVHADTLGICHYTNSNGTTYTRSFVYAFSQTYDMSSYFYNEAFAEGELALGGTASLNFDSLYMLCNYRRDADMSPSIYDTLVIGITIHNDNPVHYTNIPVSTCFYDLEFDFNTGVQQGATIFKRPLGPEDVATDSTWSVIDIPIGLNNLTNKVWSVAFTFKRGYDIGVNDTLPSDFYVLEVNSTDNDYYLGTSDNYVEDVFRCENASHGCMVWSNEVEQLGNDTYFYPNFWWDEDHFVYGLNVKVSCSDCEVVNVPELDKTNPTVYPNPATNNFTVDLGNDEKANIQLFNIVGQQVYSETITGSAQVNVANLHSGVYMLKVNQNGKVYTTKVVVK